METKWENAVMKGDVQQCKELISKGINVNYKVCKL